MPARSKSKKGHNNETQDLRDAILLDALPDVSFDGWTWAGIETAAVRAGHGREMAAAVFPGGLADVVSHFANMADRRMMERLGDIDPENLKVRERIREAVLARLRSLQSWRDAERQALAFWMVPWRAGRGARILWRTADRIWVWAGDTATDYNHYTKRALLSGVIKTTTLVWLNDQSVGFADTAAFLDRRIENVMQLGRVIGKVRKTG